ncbi:MAG TPA: hypothetical protein VD906_08075 [Caulobacteraceae bacterium]|nr:hypothetical protein [Caulobacteraceae bacterium]
MTKTLALCLLLAGAAVASCGKTGELERPGPMWGEAQATTASETETSGARARDDNGDPNQGSEGPVNVQSDANREMDPAPPRTLPIGGGPSDPGEAPPQGALPDPYNNPQ